MIALVPGQPNRFQQNNWNDAHIGLISSTPHHNAAGAGVVLPRARLQSSAEKWRGDCASGLDNVVVFYCAEFDTARDVVRHARGCHCEIRT